MQESEIKHKVNELIAVFASKTAEGIKEEDKLSELDLDSLDAVELCMEIEKEFDIEISDEELESMETPKEICELVQKKLA